METMRPHTFDPDVVAAVLRHMNTDHPADNLVIVRAFADPSAAAAVMTGLNGDGGIWTVTAADGSTTEARIAWSAPVTERAGIRREVVVLYDAARVKLGLEPRAH